MIHRVNQFIFLVLLVYFVWIEHFLALSILLAIYFMVISIGVTQMWVGYFIRSKNKLKNASVLLTFDDGPHPEYTPKILKILETESCKAIFFIIGSKAEKHPEIIQAIIDAGHIIGNHTMTHPPLFALSKVSKVNAEIEKANQTIHALTGQKPVFFRPPIGYTNPIIAKSIKELKLTVIGWTLRSYDSVFRSSVKLTSRLVKRVKPGQIILLHDNLAVTQSCLAAFITEAKKKGITFVQSKENIPL